MNKVKEVESIGECVTVACKLPHGLQLDVEINGVRNRFLASGSNSSAVFGGFGLTDGVPKDFWEAWKKEHAHMPYVKREQIWAIKDRRSAQDKAIEMAEIRHGMEQLNQNGDPRAPMDPANKIKPDDEGEE
jgi:hypothetical protein